MIVVKLDTVSSTMAAASVSVQTIVLLLLAVAAVASAQLSATFYDSSCPRALGTIRSAVTAAVNRDPRMGASLLRLHFHDCFVQASPRSSSSLPLARSLSSRTYSVPWRAQGCDASVLLSDRGSFTGEQNAFPNRGSLRGFDVVDSIKAQVEAVCPRTVSCADILAVAARDSVVTVRYRSIK